MLIQHDLREWRVHLREAVSAGEPLNPEVIAQVREAWGLTIRDGFGQTETTAQVGNPPGQPVKPGSMGRPLPGYPVALIDADGQPAQEGEICIDLAQRPLGADAGLPRRPAAQRRGHGAAATTTPAMSPAATPTATSPTSAAWTMYSSRPTTASARSSSRAC